MMMDLITPILEERFWGFFGHSKRSDIIALLQLCLLVPLFLFFDDLPAVAGSNEKCCEMFPLSYERKKNFPLCDPVKKLSEFHDSLAVKPPVVATIDLFSV